MARFEDAIGYVLANEGGYANDPDDPGGETNWGICKRDHPDVNIRSLTREQAIEIYREQYWCYDGIQAQRVATKLLDMAVQMEGTGRRGAAITIVQRAARLQLVRLSIDGIYGPETENAINGCNSTLLLSDMCSLTLVYYNGLIARNPALQKFAHDWTRRAALLPGEAPSPAEVIV
jgi:lysozyme family protein